MQQSLRNVRRFVSVILFASIVAPAFSQLSAGFAYKVDPVFRYVLDHKTELSTVAFNNFPELYKVQPTEGFMPGKTTLEKRYECIVYTQNATALRSKSIVVQAELPKLVTAWVTLDQLGQMAAMNEVTYIEAPQFDHANNDLSVGGSGASLLHQGRLNNTVYKGRGVIAAIFDSGIDWDHPDFRDPTDQTKSRIIRLWDQTLTPGAGEVSPAPFGYGVEYTQAQINDELDGTPANFVRERDVNGHGSHTSGTMTGNGAALASRKYSGIAPEADIVMIKGGDGSFSTANQINALAYLQALSTSLGKPVVLNMSIGGQSGAHDGTRSAEIAVDNFSNSAPGRVVCISAGNDNGTAIHNQLNITPGATSSVSFSVPAGTLGTDVFQFSYWANDNTAVTAKITAPDASFATATAGQGIAGPVMAGNFNTNLNNTIDAANGDRFVNLYVTRVTTGVGNPGGVWTLAITNNGASNIRVDGWLNYTNTNFAGTTVIGGDNNMLVGSPGTATTAITAAAYVAKLSWYSEGAGGGFAYNPPTQQDNIATFSALGPRRDLVQKPDLAAAGQAVASVLSSDAPNSPTYVAVNGLYLIEQGTSMASPGIAGAAALLLQANPTLTAVQVRNLMTSTASKDVLTEATSATPNPVWGYGKLDIFKAVASAFNCGPAQRKTYQYDNSNTNAAGQDGSTGFTTQRPAVRFTPDISGKLGGFYVSMGNSTFNATSMAVEVRTNNAGVPGTLLGTKNIPVADFARFAWNYFDLSSLNVSVTNGTDYFIVMVPGAGSGSWFIRRDASSPHGRSLFSSDDGATWNDPFVDYRFRSVVYSTAQLAGTIATINSDDTRDINSSNQFINSSCQLIAQLVPNGSAATAVTGSVVGRVWLEAGVPTYGGDPFVSRHYQITPVTNTANATGRVTLYFTQAEFTAFNSAPNTLLDLPANPADAVGKANLRIGKYPGNSSNGTGLPGTYSGNPVVLDPADADIVWNGSASRWEVSVDVVGFSGFVVQTNPFPLPITVESFTGIRQGNVNQLSWKVTCAGTAAIFDVERSSNGSSFSSIGTMATTQNRCSSPFDFTDATPLTGKNFYRIKITENTGRILYTGIVLLENGKSLISTLYPTIISKGNPVQVNFTGVKGNLSIVDATGRQVFNHLLLSGSQSIALPLQAAGVYFYSIKNGDTVLATGKILVQ